MGYYVFEDTLGSVLGAIFLPIFNDFNTEEFVEATISLIIKENPQIIRHSKIRQYVSY
jgi:hypothetical protein